MGNYQISVKIQKESLMPHEPNNFAFMYGMAGAAITLWSMDTTVILIININTASPAAYTSRCYYITSDVRCCLRLTLNAITSASAVFHVLFIV